MTLIHENQFGVRQRWLPAKNVGTQAIPPYAVVEVTGQADHPVEGQVWTVRRPTSATPSGFCANSSAAIAVSGYGRITFDDPFFVRYDGSTPSVGMSLGPQANDYDANDSSEGLVSLSAATYSTPTRLLVRYTDTERPRIAKTTTSVTARSGSTAGSGTVTLYLVDGATMTSDETGVTAYNFATNTIDTDTWVQVERFASSGDWYVTAVDCGA